MNSCEQLKLLLKLRSSKPLSTLKAYSKAILPSVSALDDRSYVTPKNGKETILKPAYDLSTTPAPKPSFRNGCR